MQPTCETILIVDDDRQVRRTLDATLRSWNYNCLQAENIAEAGRVFAADEPGVVQKAHTALSHMATAFS